MRSCAKKKLEMAEQPSLDELRKSIRGIETKTNQEKVLSRVVEVQV